MSNLFYIKTFGCQMNVRDSEIMEQLLCNIGYLAAPDMDAADLVILNTCSIRAKAEQKVFSLLGQLHKDKQKRPHLLIGVAGCVAQQLGQEIVQRMPHVDFVVGTQQFYNIPYIINQIRDKREQKNIAIQLDTSFRIPQFKAPVAAPLPFSRPSPRSFKKFITIMQGCNNFCAYCVVPFTRGREISRPVADILDEAQYCISQGVKEITLLGQNVNSYGQTNPVADHSVDFSYLLRKVAELEGLQRLRFTTSNPKDLSSDLMRCFREIPLLCPQFHLPAQSGSDAVLQRMNRKYSAGEYLEKVAELRRYCPGIAITTDIIVGFPGETDQDFAQTMELLETVRFHNSFSFKYSDRPGTRSAYFPNKVPEEIKTRRLLQFQLRQEEICFEHNMQYIGQHVEVMIESNDFSSMQGRTASAHIVHLSPGTDKQPGDLCQVLITKASKHSLSGNIM